VEIYKVRLIRVNRFQVVLRAKNRLANGPAGLKRK
jgi:hypothetical protein